MSEFWAKLGKMAKRLFTEDEPESAEGAKVDRSVPPLPHARQKPAVKTRPQENRVPIEVIPEFAFILETIRDGRPSLFVTGRAGTGKSTLIRFLTEQLQGCVVVAPTGLAAINVGGSTIHSFFRLPPYILNPEEVLLPSRHILPVLTSLKVLIVDEVSMVKPDVVDCIDNMLKRARGNDRPFGGVQVVFVGDLLQLPPVVADAESSKFYTSRYRSCSFFDADVFHRLKLPCVELTTVFRQASHDFISLLDRIRLNQDHREAVAQINRTCFLQKPEAPKSGMFLVTTNAMAFAINSGELNRLQTEVHQFVAVVDGKVDLDKDEFQAPRLLELKVGAQVILVKNHKPQWVNGTLGRVVSIGQSSIRVELSNSGNIVDVEREIWEKIEYRYDGNEKQISRKITGTFKQFPMTLGWAITIHKSQGMTLDSVRIDLGDGAFCSGQTYVALSRCRDIGGIQLDRPISMRDVKADPRILDFYANLQTIQRLPNSR
jgi:ATP-dependent DNA helicase PIF1